MVPKCPAVAVSREIHRKREASMRLHGNAVHGNMPLYMG